MTIRVDPDVDWNEANPNTLITALRVTLDAASGTDDTPNNVTRMSTIRFNVPEIVANMGTINVRTGMELLASVPLTLPAGTTVGSNHGIFINDLGSFGNNSSVIEISNQTGATDALSGRAGNVRFFGTNSCINGHIMFRAGGAGGLDNNDHFCRDDTNEVWRTKTDATPDGLHTSAGDGPAFVTGTGVATHGVMLWGDGSASFDQGDEVCGATGVALACVTTRRVDGTIETCAFAHSAIFYAMCQ